MDDARIKTLENAIEAMREKIEAEIPNYSEMPRVQILTTTQGDQAMRANPALQEFRATVRDYAQALNSLQNILDEKVEPEESKSLSALRSKFKVVS